VKHRNLGFYAVLLFHFRKLITNHHVMRKYGGMDVQLQAHLLWYEVSVSGRFQKLAFYFTRKSPRYLLNKAPQQTWKRQQREKFLRLPRTTNGLQSHIRSLHCLGYPDTLIPLFPLYYFAFTTDLRQCSEVMLGSFNGDNKFLYHNIRTPRRNDEE
jgi:hypothetical protein